MNFMEDQGARAADGGWHVMPCTPHSKLPGAFSRGEWHDMAGWQRFCEMPASDAEIEEWGAWPDCGVSIACGTVMGLDLDIEEPKLAQQVRDVAMRTLGKTTLVRYGRKPRAMLCYRMASPFRSRRVGPLDAMGAGRQFVAYGIHPITNEPYEWEDDSPANTQVKDLPVVDENKLARFFEEALPLLPLGLRATKLRVPTGGVGEGLLATREAVASACLYLPPVQTCSYDEFREIGMAIHSALGGDGLEFWEGWAKDDPRLVDSDYLAKKWRTFTPAGGIGAGTLFHEAKSHGWSPEPGMFLYARDKELANQPHPAQALIDRMKELVTDAPLATDPVTDEDDLRTDIDDDTPERPVLAMFDPTSPDWLQGCDGGLGLFVNECVHTAIMEQPWLSLAGALAAFSVAMGRRFMGPTGVRPNLYVLGVAPSTSGKDHPQKWAREILHSAELAKLVGGSVIASGAGMTSALEKHPVQLWVIDEVSALIKAATERGASAHMAHVNTLMLTMFSMAGATYMGTDYADKTTKPRAVIAQPSLHFFGNTTPHGFANALQSGSATDGLLGRCLLFESATVPYPNDRSPSTTFSDELLAALKAVHEGVPGHQHFGNTGESSNGVPSPYLVPFADKAAADLFRSWGILQTDRMNAMKNSVAQPLYGRMRENVQKIALIKAVARDVPVGRPPAITLADLQWASRVFERCMFDMEKSLVENVADNDYQADRNRVAKIIKTTSERDPRGATKSMIVRACQSIPQRRREEILDQLEEAGEVRKDVVPSLLGRPAIKYHWTFK